MGCLRPGSHPATIRGWQGAPEGTKRALRRLGRTHDPLDHYGPAENIPELPRLRGEATAEEHRGDRSPVFIGWQLVVRSVRSQLVINGEIKAGKSREAVVNNGFV